MADLPTLVASMRAALAAGDRARAEDVAPLAESFASRVRHAIDRQSRCIAFLRRGLRSEAVHLATIVPALTETADALGDLDRSAWADLCARFNLPAPPPLDAKMTKAIAAAIARERAVQDLVARHRTLALTRAPLPDRLATLRQLLAADPKSEMWKEQLTGLESERLKSFATDVTAALSSNDEVAIDRLYAEVTEQSWLTPPAAQLTEPLRRRMAEINARRECDAFPFADLSTAHAAAEYDRVDELLLRWEEIVERYAIVTPADRLGTLRRANAWLATETRRREQTARRPITSPNGPAESEQVVKRKRFGWW